MLEISSGLALNLKNRGTTMIVMSSIYSMNPTKKNQLIMCISATDFVKKKWCMIISIVQVNQMRFLCEDTDQFLKLMMDLHLR